jgi:hypothetical protein
MLRELLLSVASGVIVTLILQIFGMGGGRVGAPRQTMTSYAPLPRRRSFVGGLFRLVLAVIGGVALAYAAAPFVFARRFGDYGSYERYDRFEGFRSIASHAPMLILTVIGTIIVWVVLSAMTRRQ